MVGDFGFDGLFRFYRHHGLAVRFFELLGSQDKRPFLNIPRAPKPDGSGPARWLFKRKMRIVSTSVHDVSNLYAQSVFSDC